MLNRFIVAPLACGLAACSLSAAAQIPDTATPLQYMPLPAPCRAVVTTLLASKIQTVNPAGGTCSIPTPSNNIIAYAVNVTVMPQGNYLGYAAIWPAGDPMLPQMIPPTSTVNSTDGRVKSNAAIVAGGHGGEVNLFATNNTELVLDVSGYFTTDAAYVYVPITPCRLVDTRKNNGTSFGAPSLKANQPRAFPLANNLCNLPTAMLASGGALSLNVTAIPLTEPVAEVTVWGTSMPEPDPQPPPIPTLFIETPFVAANAAIVTMDQSPSDSVSASATNDVNLVMDITGYFASAQLVSTGLSLYLLPPCRLLDTRRPSDGIVLPRGFQGELTVPITTENTCNVPTNARAYVLNATVVPLPLLGYLTLWADGTPRPVVSTLNAPDGSVASNMAIVDSFNGSIDAFASNPDSTELILDLSGYFDPGP